MAKFVLRDDYIAFATDIAAGKDQYKAYLDHVATRKNIAKQSAMVNASRLMARPEIQAIIKRAQQARETEIVKITSREIAKEFSAILLETTELDAFHCAIIQGQVQVEEVIPMYNWEDILDVKGNVIKRIRKATFVKVTRPPNVREKQISVDALYKRRGEYAPSKLMGWFRGGPNQEPDELQNAEMVVVLSTGERLILP